MKNYITCELMGGLGNQMFQAAHVVAQSLKHNRPCFFERRSFTPNQGNQVSKYINNIFSKLQFVDTIENCDRVIEQSWNESNLTPTTNNTLFYGYFQSSRNFFGFEEEIKGLFLPPQEFINESYNVYPELKKEKTISIHVRIGDYAKSPHIHPSITKSYIDECLNRFGDFDHLFLFSDDKNWLKENFSGKNITIVDKDDYEELWIMSLCKNNIIANSSFSWWGAYLNQNPNKIVFAPSIWFGPGGPNPHHNIFEKKWEIINVKYLEGKLYAN